VTLRDVHIGWAWFMIVANALVGAWSLGAHRWPRLRTPVLWWCTVVAEGAVFVQVGIGVADMQANDIEPDRFHTFYGFVALISIAILYSYRTQLRERIYLLYGFGGLFVMGLGIRALLLASG
jgi:hypothetical protein